MKSVRVQALLFIRWSIIRKIWVWKYGFPVDENLQYIRDERARELCFENLRIYDLRRWRVADIDFMDGKQPHTLLLTTYLMRISGFS